MPPSNQAVQFLQTIYVSHIIVHIIIMRDSGNVMLESSTQIKPQKQITSVDIKV